MQVMLGSRVAKTCSWRSGAIYCYIYAIYFVPPYFSLQICSHSWVMNYTFFFAISCNNIHIRTRRLYFQYVFTEKTVTRCTFRVPNFYFLQGVWQDHNLLLAIISSTLLKDTANPLSHHMIASSNLSKWTQALAPVNEKKAQLSCNFCKFCSLDISRLVIQYQIKPRNEDKIMSLPHVTSPPHTLFICHFFSNLPYHKPK